MKYRKKIIFMTGMLFCLCLTTFAQSISLNLNNVTVRSAFEALKKEYKYLFVYESNDVNTQKIISVSAQDQPLDAVLKQILKGQDVTYEVNEKNIVIRKSAPVRTQAVVRQDRRITGTVVDVNDEPVVGANVVEKGTKSNGTVTDVDGNFSLNVADDAVLQVSYIGYIAQEFNVGSQTSLHIILREDMQALEEVVIIGYGSVKKRDLTGSVSRLSSNVINNQAVLNDPIQALQGKIAGADITVGNAPGTTSTIIIRGYNSLYASNNPLIVVDDAPFGGSISDINPNEIETMDILKDASSTAIYGARGANGVVIITTKRAQKDGKLRINYDGYYGLSRSLRNYDLFNGEQYADFKRAANQGKTDPEIFDAIQLEVLGTKNFTDWQELMFSDNGYKTDHSVSISQSTGKNRNMIVLGYNKDQSIISNMSYERFSARINGDLDLSPNLSVGYSSLLAVSTRNNGDNNTWGYGTLIDPLTQVYDKNGDLLFYNSGWYQTLLHSNPIFDTKKENVDSKDKRSRTLLNMFANWEIINGLKFRTSLTYDLSSIEAGRYYSSTTQARQLAAPSATFNKDTEQQLTFTNLLNYKKSMGKHNVDISLVHDMQTYKYERVGLTGQNMAYFGSWYNVSEAPDIFSRASAIREWALLSFMGRVNYTFNDRYLLTLTGRYDGSSRLAKGNQWDFFPSFALAWRLKEEEFLNEADFLSNLKLRLSWGNSGNTAIDEYATLGALGKYIYYFGENEQSAVGYLPTELANTQLGWEKTEEYDIGIDFGFMDNRINGSIDLYQRNTHDVLMQRNLPYSSGYGSTWHNIGKTRNTGIELSSNIIPIATRDFKWNVDVSFAYNKNEIVELFNGKKDSPGNNWFIGKPFYIERLYKFIGIWQTDEAEEANKYARVPGDPKIMDVNNNYIYDDDDRFIYNRIPKWTAGLSTGLYYKNWDFNIYLYSRQNYYQALPMLSHQASSTRMNHRVVDYWTPDHPTNESPLPRITESNPTLVQSDYIVRDLSFVKLKNVNLGYTFPQSFVQKIKASKLRVYFMVDNPYVWTKSDYPGLDPENCNDYFSHRPLTSYILGVNLGF